jgi:hypothetical protein
MRVRPALQQIGQRFGANVKVVEVPPGPPVLSPIVAEIYGPEAEGRRQVAQAVRRCSRRPTGVVDMDDSGIAARRARCCWSTGARPRCWACRSRPSSPRCAPAWPASRHLSARPAANTPPPVTLQLPPEHPAWRPDALLQLAVRSAEGRWCPSANW